MNAPDPVPLRFTEFSHSGGGCKIAPALLADILSKTPLRAMPKDLLVGIETSDDAAVYRLNEHQAIVATTDFFTPIVDDPFDFGRIAATNAISGVYAMGGQPIFALAVLGKPLGVGILSAALKKNRLSADGYRQMLAATTQLNTPGLELADMAGVHAMSDFTGFGLAGHLLEICRGSRLGATLRMEDMPVLEDAQALVEQGVFTGASTRNWAGYGHDVRHPAQFTDWQRNLLSDPQTAGGLLVACAPAAVEEVLQVFRGQGFARASVIGVMHDGDATLTIAP